MSSTTTTNSVGFRSERGPILIALMLTTGLVAIDSTILATAVPSIVKDLGGFAAFPWLFSIYLLAQAVSVPVYAKLADVIGRKPIVLIGIGLFLLGSVLSGFAWSMPVLIAFAVIWGISAGIGAQAFYALWTAELFATVYRSTAQGVLFFAVRIACGLISYVMPTLLANNGVHFVGALMMGLLLVGLVVGLVWAPDTEGKSLKEIELERYGDLDAELAAATPALSDDATSGTVA